MAEQENRRLRWRLLLGESTEDLLGGLLVEMLRSKHSDASLWTISPSPG